MHSSNALETQTHIDGEILASLRLFDDLLSLTTVSAVHNCTQVKRDGWNTSRACLSHARRW